MAKQRYVNTKLWRDTWVTDLDATEKLLFLYLLTNPNTNIAGIYEISLRQIALDTNIDQEAIKRLFGRFSDVRKVFWERGWIVIPNFIKHQSLNPKIAKGIRTELDAIPNWLRAQLDNEMDPKYIPFDRLLIGYDSLSHSNSNSNSNLNTNSNAAKAARGQEMLDLTLPDGDQGK